MGSIYLKDLADKTRRGLEGRIRAGRVTGTPAYGYEVVRKLTKAGELDRGIRAIDPAETQLSGCSRPMPAGPARGTLHANSTPRVWRGQAAASGTATRSLVTRHTVMDFCATSSMSAASSGAAGQPEGSDPVACGCAGMGGPRTSWSRTPRSCGLSTTRCGSGS